MATFSSDYQTTTQMIPGGSQSSLYGGGGGGSWDASPAPVYSPSITSRSAPSLANVLAGGGLKTVSTPSVPSVPGTQSAYASALKQKAPTVAVPTITAPSVYEDPNAAGVAGTNAMLAARMSALAQANGSITTAPAGVNYSPSSYPSDPYSPSPMSNEEKLANYTPEAVQGMYGGNEYSTTNAGLTAPNRADYASAADYSKAMDTFNRLQLMEQETEANSAARQYVDQKNSEQAAIDLVRQKQAAAAAAVAEVARKSKQDRDALSARLAARGLDPNTDSWAMQQMTQLDQLDREEQRAAAEQASLTLDAARGQTNDLARKALADRLASIAKAKSDLAATDTKRQSNAIDMLLANAKEANYNSQVDARTADTARKQQETDLKADLNPSAIAKNEASAANLNASATYTGGAKTENTQASTEKMKAETNRINTLTPLEAQRMQAQVNKLLSSGSSKSSGGNASQDEFDRAYDSLLAAGVSPTDKAVALAVKRYRGEDTNITSSSLGGVTAKAKAQAAGSGSGGYDWLNSIQ